MSIEDAAELQLRQTHIVRMETRPANIEGAGAIRIRDLVINALRMRPDRIIVGEVRGEEALDMMQAMNTGHDGSLTTIHANSPRDGLSRLEVMMGMANASMSIQSIRQQITSAIDIFIHVARFSDGSRHITHISECVGMESDTITTQDIFLFERQGVTPGGRVIGRLPGHRHPPGLLRDHAHFGNRSAPFALSDRRGHSLGDRYESLAVAVLLGSLCSSRAVHWPFCVPMTARMRPVSRHDGRVSIRSAQSHHVGDDPARAGAQPEPGAVAGKNAGSGLGPLGSAPHGPEMERHGGPGGLDRTGCGRPLCRSKFARLFGPVGPVLGALLLGAVPFLYLLHRTSKTMRAFQEQLPDAIDFLARSVRTGNAFSITLELLIPETTEPLRSEFLKVSRELALGSALDVALKNLVARVPLLELRFFVAAVLLQRETGGNLAETLNKLSFSIRERLRLKSQIQAASSQGRLTARVLTVLPVALALIMNMIIAGLLQGHDERTDWPDDANRRGGGPGDRLSVHEEDCQYRGLSHGIWNRIARVSCDGGGHRPVRLPPLRAGRPSL